MAAKVKPSTNGHTNRIADIIVPPKSKQVQITAPNMQRAVLKIRGTSPYVQNKFSNKARQIMMDKQAAGSTAAKGVKRTPKDFEACCKEATYVTPDGGYGIPCGAFRAALVSACRTVNFKMTHAKLALKIIADTHDATDIGTDLVAITKGKPKRFEAMVRNDSGVADIRSRPMWAPGWEASVTIEFDADMFTVEDVSNLLARVGCQIGVGEGRADSKDSCGMGWGSFELVN
jgi:hypothetical protein